MKNKRLFIVSLIVFGLIINGFNIIGSAYENIGGYTEVDPNNRIDLSGVRCSFVDLTNGDSDTYAYADKGVAYFGSFEHWIDVKIISQAGSSMVVIWGVADNLGSFTDNYWNIYPELCVNFDDSGIALKDSHTIQADTFSCDVDNGSTWYLIIERVDGLATVEIYLNAERTGEPLDTLSLETDPDTYRYIFVNQNYGGAGSDKISGYCENLELTPPPLINVAPVQTGEVPVNASTGISLSPNLYVLCTDPDDDNLNATWWSNSSEVWLQFASNWTSFANNTNITQSFINATDYNTKYYWSLNLTDGIVWLNVTYHFTIGANIPPTQSGEVPANQSISITLMPNLYILCIDNDNHNMNATWWSNSSGSWLLFASNWTSFANNTNITQTFTNATAFSTTYYWSVNLTDSLNWTNATYYFTTRVFIQSLNISNPFPLNNSIGICPCIDYLSIDIETNGTNMNLSFYYSVAVTSTFYILNNYSNITTASYSLCMCGLIIQYNTTYYWYINLSEYNVTSNYNVSDIFQFDTTDDPSDCNISEGLTEAEADEIYLGATFDFSTNALIFIFWIFLVVLGEWKDDWLYKILQLPIGLTYGVTLLASDTYLGLGLLFASIYILALAYWQGRKDKKE